MKLPKCWKGRTPPKEYFAPVDYNNPPPCPYNLPAMARYAKSIGKEIAELSCEEVERFRVKERETSRRGRD